MDHGLWKTGWCPSKCWFKVSVTSPSGLQAAAPDKDGGEPLGSDFGYVRFLQQPPGTNDSCFWYIGSPCFHNCRIVMHHYWGFAYSRGRALDSPHSSPAIACHAVFAHFWRGGVSLLNAAPYSDGRIAHVYERERPNGVHRLVSAECTLRFFVCFPRADVISKTWTTIFAFFLFFFALL